MADTVQTQDLEAPPWTGVTEGRIVHIRRPGIAHCTPGIVVRAWGGDYVNVLLFPDGANDGYPALPDPRQGPPLYALPWATSIRYEGSPEFMPGNPGWHWPERA